MVSPRRLAPAVLALALAAAPAAARAAMPSAYAMDGASPGGIFEFDVGPDGFLGQKPAGPAPAGSTTQDMAVLPNARSAYAVAGGSTIYEFSVGAQGELIPNGSVTAGTNMSSVGVSPDGQSVYATDRGGNLVYQYSVGADGSLVAKTTPTLGTGNGPVSVAVNPDGASVYVVNVTSHDVYRYPAGGGGALGAPSAPVQAGTAPSTIALTPDGHNAFVTDTGGNQVLQYAVASGGTLAANGSAGSGASPTGIAVSPDGKSAYASNSGDGSISQYDVGAGGGLASKGSAVSLVGGSAPQRLAVAPSGTRLFVPDSASGHNVLYEFATSAGGAIAPGTARFIGAGTAPTAVTVLPDQGPAAAFSAPAAVAGAPTAFDAGASTDPDGSVTHFDWDFGDGSTALDAGPRPSHTYAQPGNYTVTLSVSDDAGCASREVFTGRTAYCNGNPAAVTTRAVAVSPAAAPLGPVFFAGVAAHSQTVKVDKHGLTRISVRCPRGTFGSCIGTLTLVTAGKVRVRSHGRAKRLLMGQAGFNIPSGKAVRIPVQISKAGRRVLAHRRFLKTNATIQAHDRLMNSRKTAFSVRLKPPKPPARHR